MALDVKQNKKIPYSFILKIILITVIIVCYFRYPNWSEEYPQMYVFAKGLSIFLIPSVLVSIISYFMITVYNARHSSHAVRGNFVLGINRLSAIINVLFAIIGIMIAFGINPKEFITSMTIVAMAIAVIFRDYITNMISGLIIMFSEQLSVGDRIKVGNYQGRIVDITLANLLLQDEEDDIVMVPNNLMFNSTFVNLSAHRSSLFTVRFQLPLHASAEIDQLEQELKLMLQHHPNISENEVIEIKVVEIAKDLVNYKIDLHAVNNSNSLHRKLENEILRHILKYESDVSKSS